MKKKPLWKNMKWVIIWTDSDAPPKCNGIPNSLPCVMHAVTNDAKGKGIKEIMAYHKKIHPTCTDAVAIPLWNLKEITKNLQKANPKYFWPTYKK